MPKIIENIRESLMENAEKVLLEEGISAVTVRRISAESGIASGTVYHYFSSKEDILAAVFLKRWIEKKEKICKKVAKAKDFQQAMKLIHEGLMEFALENRPYWQGKDMNTMAAHHAALANEIAGMVERSSKELGDERMASYARLIAENILLSLHVDENLFDQFMELL